MRVRLTTALDEQIEMESPYDAAFVAAFKAAIPPHGRAWDGERKRWAVSLLYLDELLTFVHQWPGCQVQDARQAEGRARELPPMPDDLREAFDTLALAYHAPLCVAEASYRAWAKACHPDMGGDPEQMQAASRAIAVIRRYLDPKDDDIPF